MNHMSNFWKYQNPPFARYVQSIITSELESINPSLPMKQYIIHNLRNSILFKDLLGSITTIQTCTTITQWKTSNVKTIEAIQQEIQWYADA